MAVRPSHFHLELPVDLIPILDQLGAGQTIDDRVKISLAIGLYMSHVVSLARAAEIANQSLYDFINVLQQRQISWCTTAWMARRCFGNELESDSCGY